MNVSATQPPLAISIQGLSFAWSPSSATVLQVPEFTLAAGEAILLAGASGSGKTTLLSLISGIAVPQHGTLDVLGTALSKMTSKDRDQFRADHLGVVFQLFNLLPYLTLIDNVTLPCRFSSYRRQRTETLGGPEKAAQTLLGNLGLADRTMLRRPVTQLSVGQQQRVAIARALIGDPGLVIADEPTSALDADTRDTFLTVLRDACTRSGASLLFVSHDSSLAPHFDRRVDMVDLNTALTCEANGVV